MKSKNAPQSVIIELLKKNGYMTRQQILEALEGQYTDALSSAITSARQKVGLSLGVTSQKKPVLLEEVEKSAELPAILGYTTKETIEILEAVNRFALDMGGIPRVIDSLKVLQKFRGEK